MLRSLTLLAAVGAGLLLAVLVPSLPERGRTLLALTGLVAPPRTSAGDDGHGHGGGGGGGHGAGETEGEKEGKEGVVAMSGERVAAAGIAVAPAAGGAIARTLTVPGVIAMDADRVGHVAARVIGTVAELAKRLGDGVAKGETVAVLDSREVAEAKSELLAALVNQDLQSTLFEREQSLWDKKISAEQQYLRARTSFSEAGLRVDLARQKLTALGVGDREVAGVRREAKPFRQVASTEPELPKALGLQRYELRSPVAGRVVDRRVDLGAPVGGEGQEKVIYVVADLSSVWVELAVPTADLAQVREGQAVRVGTGSGGTGPAGPGEVGARIVFISPMLNQDTRSARVIASMENRDLAWRPGSFVTARITLEEQPVEVRLPRAALQSVKGEQVVFVRTREGFEKREVVLGRQDDEAVEVVFGLDPGEAVAVANSFVLKAELGKAEAEHAH